MSDLKERRLQKQVYKLISKRLAALPDNSMGGTSLDAWITEQVQENPRFGDVSGCTVSYEQDGSVTVSIQLKSVIREIPCSMKVSY